MKHHIPILFIVGTVLLPTRVHAQAAPPLATLKADAENGDADAQAKLGDVYRGKLDSENALLWYRKAAAQGVAHAQSEAGRILIGFANSPLAKPAVKVEHGEEAIQWLLQAANQGEQAAQLGLGRQFESGKFIKQDQVEAYKWFTLAAKDGNPLIPKELEAKWARDAIILKLSQEQIAEGQKRVAAFAPHQIASTELPEPTWVKEIKLQGLSGNEPRRLAIINGKSFQKGDQAEIKAGVKSVKIRCVEVRQTSVTVVIDGLPGRFHSSAARLCQRNPSRGKKLHPVQLPPH